MEIYQNIISAISGKKQRNGSFVGYCPAHVDKSPSLSISFKDNKILLKCFTGCSYEDIKSELKKQNAWPEFKSQNRPEKIEPESETDDSKLERVKELIKNTIPIKDNSIPDKYLKNRGIYHCNISSLRHNPNLFCSDVKKEVNALVGIIQSKNNSIGVLNIFLDNHSKKITKKSYGNVTGGFIYIGHSTEILKTIHIAEGIETSLAIYKSINEPILCAVNANNLFTVQIPNIKNVEEIHIWADKDKSQTGQRLSEATALKYKKIYGKKVYIHLPQDEILEKSKGVDWLDVLNNSNARLSIKKSLNLKSEFDESKVSKQGLDKFHEKYPKFITPITYTPLNLDPEILPTSIQEWVESGSRRLQVPIEMIAIPLIAVCSSLIGRKIFMFPKQKDNWKVFPNLWGIVIAPPSSFKSPSIELSLKKIENIAYKALDENKKIIKANESKVQYLESRIAGIKKDIEKEKNENSNLSLRLKELLAELHTLIPKPKRWMTNDSTIEKIVEIIEENPNGLLIYRDELSALFKGLEKSGREQERSFLLEAWTGDGNLTIDRKTTGTTFVKGLCISIIGSTQPSVIKNMINEMKSNKLNDGFFQRFQLAIWPTIKKDFELIDEEPQKEIEDKIDKIFQGIIDLNPEQIAYKFGDTDLYFLKYNLDAQQEFNNYYTKLTTQNRLYGDDNEIFQAHIGKFGKLIASISLIFFVIDKVSNKDFRKNYIPIEYIKKSILFADFLISHAKKIYNIESKHDDHTAYLLSMKILEGKIKNGDRIRSIYKNEWSGLSNYEDVESGLRKLEDLNWLDILNEPTKGRTAVKIVFRNGLIELLENRNLHNGQNNEDYND